MLTDVQLAEIKEWNVTEKPSSFCEPPHFYAMPKFPMSLCKMWEHGGIKRVLDVGCYTGFFIDNLQRFGFKTSGVDIQKELMLMVKQNTGLDTRFANAEDLPFKDGEFDCVTMLDSLEHVLDDKKAISEAERVTKKGGLIIINLPRDFEEPDDSGEHIREYTEEYIKELFGKKKDYKLEYCIDEKEHKTSFITYRRSI